MLDASIDTLPRGKHHPNTNGIITIIVIKPEIVTHKVEFQKYLCIM